MLIKNKYFKVGTKFGLFGAILCLISYSVVWAMGTNPLLYNKLLDLLLLPLFVFFGIKEFKSNEASNELRFWQGMSVGMIVFSTMAIVSSVFFFFLAEIIRPDLLVSFVVKKIELLAEQKETIVDSLGEVVYDDTVTGVKNTSAFQIGLDDYIKKTLIGMFFTVLFSIILRTSNLK